mgnify:CR=1 FL=1
MGVEYYENEFFIYNQIPIRFFDHKFYGEDIFTDLHWHRSIEINLVTKGRINFQIDGKNYLLEEGQWIIVNSGEMHANSWVERTDTYEAVAILISKSFLEGWASKDKYYINPQRNERDDNITKTLLKIREIYNSKQETYKLELMEQIFSLIRYLESYSVEMERKEKNEQPTENVKKIINYIDEHYSEELSLAMVAEQMNYSVAHLSRLFKEHVGYNFSEYVQGVRIANAVKMLREDAELPLMRCALESGFPNVKSFIQAFKRQYGCTPSEWKKKNINK